MKGNTAKSPRVEGKPEVHSSVTTDIEAQVYWNLEKS